MPSRARASLAALAWGVLITLAGAVYFWAWGIDTVIPMRALETQGKGKDRADCMRQFKAAWERFAADEANLTEFLDAKGKRH